MKVATLDNGIETETRRAITWQFDNAANLVGVIGMLKDFFAQSTKTFWDEWPVKVGNISTADDFGLAVWGKLLDCRRPTLNFGTPASPDNHILSAALYRKILAARFRLLNGRATVHNYCRYIHDVFGDKMKVIDGFEMNLTFTVNAGKTLTTEEAALVAQAPDVAFVYPCGVKNNTLQDPIAFGYCGTSSGERPVSWDGNFTYGTESNAYVRKMDAPSATLIWRAART